MTKQSAPAPLDAGLITIKGDAMPTPAVASGDAALLLADVSKSVDAQVPKSAATHHKALTVKLDAKRYKALKTIGLELDMSSQDIFVLALDQWLSRQVDARPVGSSSTSD